MIGSEEIAMRNEMDAFTAEEIGRLAVYKGQP